jgi:transposase InsO family protein
MAAPSLMSLPRGWPRLVKSALLHAVGLARTVVTEVHAGFENSPLQRARDAATLERLRARVAVLEEVLRIKDRRMALIAPERRPHYLPEDRLAILALRAAQGWNASRTAREFLLSPPTIAEWMKKLDQGGPEALVRLPEPVSRLPDLVAVLVQKLRATVPSMGRVRLAQVLARAGVVLAASTVKRLAERRVALPEPPRPRAGGERAPAKRRVSAKRAHHVWHVDLTVVPTGLGFWLPWFPFSLPVVWPFCFWVAAVVDHFSRSVVAKRSFRKEPSGSEVCALLDAAVGDAGVAPRHVVSDQGPQFGDEYLVWCGRHGARPRFGKIGEHGSIAVIERFWRSMKDEGFRRMIVPLGAEAFERELHAYVGWYNEHRPHRALGGRTPAEVRDGVAGVAERPALETRPRYPLARAGPGRRRRRRLRGRLELRVGYFEGRAHLPVVQIVELRRAA